MMTHVWQQPMTYGNIAFYAAAKEPGLWEPTVSAARLYTWMPGRCGGVGKLLLPDQVLS